MGIFSQPPRQTPLPPAQQPQSEQEAMERQIESIYGYSGDDPQKKEDESAMAKFMKYLVALRRSQMARSQQQYVQTVG